MWCWCFIRLCMWGERARRCEGRAPGQVFLLERAVLSSELSLLPHHGEFQICGHDELVWNKLAVLTAQTAPALGYKLKQKQPYLHISATSPWKPIHFAWVFRARQTKRLPALVVIFGLSVCHKWSKNMTNHQSHEKCLWKEGSLIFHSDSGAVLFRTHQPSL